MTLRTIVLHVALVLILSSAVTAQDPPTSAARPDRGRNTQGTYAVSDIESINLTNGNLSLSIPLASLPAIAGGKLSWTIQANYNSKLWNLKNDERPADLTHLNQPYFHELLPRSNDGGWKIGEAYNLEIHDVDQDVTQMSCQGAGCVGTDYRWRYTLHTPDGSAHEMRPLGASVYTGNQPWRRGYYQAVGANSRLYSFDGSYLWAKVNITGGQVAWAVYLPDGTRVETYFDGVQRIKDNNNNSIKIYTEEDENCNFTTHYVDE
jgi:hypothetical protein